MDTRGCRAAVVAGLVVLAAAVTPGWAQSGTQSAPGVDGSSGSSKSNVGIVKLPNPGDPGEKEFRAAQKKRGEMEKELRKIRAQYFNGIRNTEIRQVGMGKLRKYTDPAAYSTLLTLFKDDEKDVRTEILQMLIDQRSDEADAAIAWAAVFDNDKWFREEATKRLLDRTKDVGVSNRVKSVIALGLKDTSNEVIGAAAQMAAPLKLFEAIPMLISTQVAGGGGAGTGNRGGGVDDGDGALAIITIGQQVAFVSDLTPVVGDSAVAFDPTLSVATNGVYIRVIDAYVITYRTEVNAALISLANAGWDGRDTASMGWDQKKWREWYAKEFVPYREKVAAGAKESSPG